MSPIILYDLVPTSSTPPGPSFSPFCMRARLALLRKGIEFETRFVTYHEMRFGGWKEKLGNVDLVTAPIIQKPDGTYLMDSTEIALWLDETFPSKPNLFLPGSTSVDLESAAYKETIKNFDTVLKDIAAPERAAATGIRRRGALWCGIFWLYAKRIVKLFDKETEEYWIDDGRLGEGTFKSVLTTDQDELVGTVRAGVEKLSAHLEKTNQVFFSSKDEPGMTDFALFGDLQLIRSVSPRLFKECFLDTKSEESKGLRVWVERMDEMFPMKDVRERDRKEEVEL